MTSNESAVLSLQLQGIMDCWDMQNLFCLLEMSQLCNYHKKRLVKMICCHQHTNCLMIKRYNEAGEIPYEYNSALKYPLKADADKSSLVNAVLDRWVKWVADLSGLYKQLTEEDSEYRAYWTKMYHQLQHESDIANKAHQKYYAAPVTKSIRSELRAKLAAANAAE